MSTQLAHLQTCQQCHCHDEAISGMRPAQHVADQCERRDGRGSGAKEFGRAKFPLQLPPKRDAIVQLLEQLWAHSTKECRSSEGPPNLEAACESCGVDGDHLLGDEAGLRERGQREHHAEPAARHDGHTEVGALQPLEHAAFFTTAQAVERGERSMRRVQSRMDGLDRSPLLLTRQRPPRQSRRPRRT
eukprot:scaffold265965_cov30-Tisochrysis_lutea.AAC.2